MFKHILKKTLIAIATIWLIITISFTLVHTMPGDPIIFLIGEEEYYYLLERILSRNILSGNPPASSIL